MTRPRKQTVDYFPHYCHHGKTMRILEQKYGNDGYAFWFKILELLGSSEGHFINCGDSTSWEYLQSITRLDSETCQEILDLLARVQAIDTNLWNEKIIWSDNFIQGIAYAYRNRVEDIPDKPSIQRKKPSDSGVSDVRNPGIEKKGIEKNNRKERNRRETTLPSDFEISDAVLKWANEKGFTRLDERLESFRDYALSTGKTYVDWDSAFKRSIREDWAKLNGGNGVMPRRGPPMSKADQVTSSNLAAAERVLKKWENQEPS